MKATRFLVLVALFAMSLTSVPSAMAGRSGECPFRTSLQVIPRGNWAYEAVWDLAHGTPVLGDYREQATLERFSTHRMCRLHFAKLTARILKHRAWRLRGDRLDGERMEQLAALIGEFRYDFAMLGGDPERLDVAFADALREESVGMRCSAPRTRVITLSSSRVARRNHRGPRHAPFFLGLIAMLLAAFALQRLERDTAVDCGLLATRFSI
jgi:hypothetical protein